MVKCVVSGCPNRTADHKGLHSRPQKRFFPFPKDPARVKVWLAALRENERQDSTEQQLICEDHFLTEDITSQGIGEDAIPIMPPFLDGPLGLVNPWGAESDEELWEDEPAVQQLPPRKEQDGTQGSRAEAPSKQVEKSPPKPREIRSTSRDSRHDVSLRILTKRFLELLLAAPDGVLDLNQVAMRLQTRKRRVYDITNVLDGIHVIKKESVNKIKWIGKAPVASFLGNQRFQRELENLKIVEETLDELIKTCARQLFDMTDDTDNIGSAYVTHEDISKIKVFQEQTVIVVKAPEETKLEVPTPKEDSIQIHLKGGKGPISVLTCEMERPAAEKPGSERTGGFMSLEESRIQTSPLNTDAMAPQSAVQSA